MISALLQTTHDDVDVGVALESTGEPAAQNGASRGLDQAGTMVRGPGTGRQHGTGVLHFLVIVDLTVGSVTGKRLDSHCSTRFL